MCVHQVVRVPSLISLTVSLDVKHQCLLTCRGVCPEIRNTVWSTGLRICAVVNFFGSVLCTCLKGIHSSNKMYWHVCVCVCVCVCVSCCCCCCLQCVCAVLVLLLCIIVYYFKGMYEYLYVFVLYCIIVLYYYNITVLHNVRLLEQIWICAIQIPFLLTDWCVSIFPLNRINRSMW